MTRRIELPAFAKRVRDLGGEMKTAVQIGMVRAAQRFDGMLLHEIDHADPFPAVDRGQLRNSRQVRTTGKGTITYTVDAPHYRPIDEGTRPFFPPIEPLIAWCMRKGLGQTESETRSIAYAIQQAIGKRGIKPRNFTRKAVARFKSEKVVAREVGAELKKLARKNGGK